MQKWTKSPDLETCVFRSSNLSEASFLAELCWCWFLLGMNQNSGYSSLSAKMTSFNIIYHYNLECWTSEYTEPHITMSPGPGINRDHLKNLCVEVQLAHRRSTVTSCGSGDPTDLGWSRYLQSNRCGGRLGGKHRGKKADAKGFCQWEQGYNMV